MISSFRDWVLSEMALWDSTGSWKVRGREIDQEISAHDALRDNPGITARELFMTLLGSEAKQFSQEELEKAYITFSAQINGWERNQFIKKDRGKGKAHKLYLGSGKSVEQDIEDLESIQGEGGLDLKSVLKSILLHYNRYMKKIQDGDYRAIPDFFQSVGQILSKNNFQPEEIVRSMSQESSDKFNPMKDEFKWTILSVMGTVLGRHYGEEAISNIIAYGLSNWGEQGKVSALQKIIQINPKSISKLLDRSPEGKQREISKELLPSLVRVKKSKGEKAVNGLLDVILGGLGVEEEIRAQIAAA